MVSVPKGCSLSLHLLSMRHLGRVIAGDPSTTRPKSEGYPLRNRRRHPQIDPSARSRNAASQSGSHHMTPMPIDAGAGSCGTATFRSCIRAPGADQRMRPRRQVLVPSHGPSKSFLSPTKARLRRLRNSAVSVGSWHCRCSAPPHLQSHCSRINVAPASRRLPAPAAGLRFPGVRSGAREQQDRGLAPVRLLRA